MRYRHYHFFSKEKSLHQLIDALEFDLQKDILMIDDTVNYIEQLELKH